MGSAHSVFSAFCKIIILSLILDMPFPVVAPKSNFIANGLISIRKIGANIWNDLLNSVNDEFWLKYEKVMRINYV